MVLGGEEGKGKAQHNLLRIGIGSLGGLLWGADTGLTTSQQLSTFLLALRSILRSGINMPRHIYTKILVAEENRNLTNRSFLEPN